MSCVICMQCIYYTYVTLWVLYSVCVCECVCGLYTKKISESSLNFCPGAQLLLLLLSLALIWRIKRCYVRFSLFYMKCECRETAESQREKEERGQAVERAVKLCVCVCVKVDVSCCCLCCTANVASLKKKKSYTHAHTHTERNYPIAVPNELNFHFFAPTAPPPSLSLSLSLHLSHFPLPLGFLVELLQRCQTSRACQRAARDTHTYRPHSLSWVCIGFGLVPVLAVHINLFVNHL